MQPLLLDGSRRLQVLDPRLVQGLIVVFLGDKVEFAANCVASLCEHGHDVNARHLPIDLHVSEHNHVTTCHQYLLGFLRSHLGEREFLGVSLNSPGLALKGRQVVPVC